MATRIRNSQGALERIEFDAEEFAELLAVSPDDLASWRRALAPFRYDGQRPIYAVSSREELKLARKRAQILRTGMGEKALAEIERRGLLAAYAALALDCPPGLTAHVWRSYGVVVFMQARYGVKIGAEELAKRAHIDVEMAHKHLRLLQALGYLRSVLPGEQVKQGSLTYIADKPEWLHQGLPRAWRGAEEEDEEEDEEEEGEGVLRE
jgi:hypothetical protein